MYGGCVLLDHGPLEIVKNARLPVNQIYITKFTAMIILHFHLQM